MKHIILAWLNANASNEVKANEIDYQCEKFIIEFLQWYETYYEGVNLDYKDYIEIFKKQRN
jgi:hypothetical protein